MPRRIVIDGINYYMVGTQTQAIELLELYFLMTPHNKSEFLFRLGINLTPQDLELLSAGKKPPKVTQGAT